MSNAAFCFWAKGFKLNKEFQNIEVNKAKLNLT